MDALSDFTLQGLQLPLKVIVALAHVLYAFELITLFVVKESQFLATSHLPGRTHEKGLSDHLIEPNLIRDWVLGYSHHLSVYTGEALVAVLELLQVRVGLISH